MAEIGTEKKDISQVREIIYTILTCSINMVFFTLIPVTVERSVSVFMLSVSPQT